MTNLAKLNRGNCELNLISFACEAGDLGFLIEEDIDASYFTEYAELPERLYRKFERDGTLPSINVVRSRYPDIGLPDACETRDMHVFRDSLRSHHADALIIEMFTKMRDSYREGDFDTVLNGGASDIEKIRQVLTPKKIMSLLDDAPVRYERYRSKAQGLSVHATEFAHPDVNDYIGGMRGQELITYVSRPGVGKSFSVLLDAYHCWAKGVPVLFVSLEMSAEQVGYRFDSLVSAGLASDPHGYNEAGFSNVNLQRGIAVKNDVLEVDRRATMADEESAKEYEEHIAYLAKGGIDGTLPQFYIVTPQTSDAQLTPEYIHSLAKELKVGLVVVDYLLLVPSSNKRLDTRTRLAEVSAAFKQSALTLDIPFLVPHQLNRDAEQAQEITVANFAESDAVGQNVDIGILIEKEADVIKYRCLKVRGGPMERTFAWVWDHDSGRRRPFEFYNSSEGAA